MKVNGKHYRSLWADESLGVVHIIDQTRLPHVFETATIASAEAMADAIRGMPRGGAPAPPPAPPPARRARDPNGGRFQKRFEPVANHAPDGREPRVGDRAH